jgi:hypothetical protein
MAMTALFAIYPQEMWLYALFIPCAMSLTFAQFLARRQMRITAEYVEGEHYVVRDCVCVKESSFFLFLSLFSSHFLFLSLSSSHFLSFFLSIPDVILVFSSFVLFPK